MPIESLVLFTFASILLALAPGPDNIFVLTQSSLYGKRSGIFITLGLCSGLIFHTCLVAMGVASLMQATDWAFIALKTVGALYLLYLAWQLMNNEAQIPTEKSIVIPAKALYLRGIIMNVTNPKVTIFFLAFLPQFADPVLGPVVPQIFLLGAIFGMVSLVIFSGVAMLAAGLGDWLKTQYQAQIYLQRITALMFVLLAVNLILA